MEMASTREVTVPVHLKFDRESEEFRALMTELETLREFRRQVLSAYHGLGDLLAASRPTPLDHESAMSQDLPTHRKLGVS
jgi:hypothetical protein